MADTQSSSYNEIADQDTQKESPQYVAPVVLVVGDAGEAGDEGQGEDPYLQHRSQQLDLTAHQASLQVHL